MLSLLLPGFPASSAGVCAVYRASTGALPWAGVRRHQRGCDPRRTHTAAGTHNNTQDTLFLGPFWSAAECLWTSVASLLQRDNVVNSFRSGKIWVLICTALLARGIDFKGVNLVLNYDFPTSSVEYIHRIGSFLYILPVISSMRSLSKWFVTEERIKQWFFW